MNIEIVRGRLDELGLTQAAQVLDSRAEQAVKADWSYIEFVDHLFAEELAVRKERSLKARTRLARIPAVKTLADFDFEAQPGVDRQLINELATLTFIDRTDNICFLGPPGVGKSHLAVGLALRALEEGYTAYFTTLNQLVTDLKRAEVNHTLDRRFRVYLKPKVLVLDEMGYLPLDRGSANLLFELVSRRYERGSIILTSNKAMVIGPPS